VQDDIAIDQLIIESNGFAYGRMRRTLALHSIPKLNPITITPVPLNRELWAEHGVPLPEDFA
jgi:hypothetical protein